MAGPARTVSPAHRASSSATGAISTTPTRGTSPAGEAQKASMPARVMATTVASPDRIRAAISAQAVAGTPPSPAPNSGASMANLAKKPESGGSPASSSAQPMKPSPRTAMVAGIATPTSSSSSRCSSRRSPSASRVTASTSAPTSRPRSTSSISRKNAAIAGTELAR